MNKINYPVIIKNVLPKKCFETLWEEIEENWSFINQSIKDGPVFWGKRYNNDLTSIYASTIVKLKIQKLLKRKLNLIRIQHNAQTGLQETNFHVDATVDNVWTFVLFTSPYWNTNWGGEFVLLNNEKRDFDYVRYFPNNGVLFPSYWEHKGNSPQKLSAGIRTTVAFQFCDYSIYDQLIDEHPKFGIYR